MAEISKTAEAARKAVEKSKKKDAKELTVDERIRNLRNNVTAGLYVPVTEVALLLERYDGVIEAFKVSQDLKEKQEARAKYAEEQQEAWHREFDKMVEIRDGFVKQLDELQGRYDGLRGLGTSGVGETNSQ